MGFPKGADMKPPRNFYTFLEAFLLSWVYALLGFLGFVV
jgi:hypothetical protein